MEISLIILIILQGVNLFIYGWVVRTFFFNDPCNHPPIFRNLALRNILTKAPGVIIIVLIVFAFLFTNSPWLFLGISIAGWVYLSSPPGT